MKRLFTIIFFSFLCVSCIAQTNHTKIPIQEYFPEHPGTSYNYSWQFAKKGEDSLSGIWSIICMRKIINGVDVFYFDNDTSSKTNFINSNMFGDGVYTYKAGSLYVYPISWKTELHQMNLEIFTSTTNIEIDMSTEKGFRVLFPKEIELLKTYILYKGDCTRRYTAVGFEDIIINNVIIKNCLKFETTEEWPNKKYVGAFWLLKNFGVVKRIRSTGRVEVIDLKQLPKN